MSYNRVNTAGIVPTNGLISSMTIAIWRKQMSRLRNALLAVAGLSMLTGTAYAADLPVRTDPPPPVIAPPVFTWTGFYVGVNAGYAWGDNQMGIRVPGVNINAAATTLARAVGRNSHSVDGFLLGLTAGYNVQVNSVVVGIEGDINYFDASGSRRTTRTIGGQSARVTDRTTADWFGTLRGRFGIAMDRTLLYVTGGLAFSDIGVRRQLDWTFADGCPPVGGGFQRCHRGSDKVNIGGVFGAGIEHAFTNNWSAKFEYLYARFPRQTFRTVNVGLAVNQPLFHRSRVDFHILRAGINYRF